MFNNDGTFSNSRVFQYITQPKDETKKADTDMAKFSSLGTTIKDVKAVYKKYMQEFSMSFLENLKFSLLMALYRQIAKYPLQNMGADDPDYIRYGSIKASSSSSNDFFGYKKSIYEKFKQVFAVEDKKKTTSTTTAPSAPATSPAPTTRAGTVGADEKKYIPYYDLTFNQVQKGNPLVYSFYGDQISNHYFTGVNPEATTTTVKSTETTAGADENKSGKLVFGSKERFYPIYKARSSSGGVYLSDPLGFVLSSSNLAYAPTRINYEKGTYDQSNVDTDHYFRNTTQFNKSSVTGSNGTRYLYNTFIDKKFEVDKKTSKLIPATTMGTGGGGTGGGGMAGGAMSGTSTVEKASISQKAYLLDSPGLNVFAYTFLPIMEIFVRNELDYFAKNPEKRSEKSFNIIKTQTNLYNISLKNVMALNYKDFVNQSRGDISYYKDSSNKRIKVKSTSTSSGSSSTSSGTDTEGKTSTEFTDELKKGSYTVGPNMRHSVISEANAYTFYLIAKELYENIYDYASITPAYNNGVSDKGAMK